MWRCLRMGQTLSLQSRNLHQSSWVLYPRGIPKTDQTSSPDAANRWEDFVNEKKRIWTPLANEHHTVFGSVRFDSQNQVDYHGQEDDLEDEVDTADQSGLTERPESSKASSDVQTCDNFFFEDTDSLKTVQTFELDRKESQSSRRLSDQKKDAELPSKSAIEESAKGFHEVDEQYFGNVLSQEEENFGTISEPPKVSVDIPSNEISSETGNYIDDQYFQKSSIASISTITPVSPADFADLNYIDRQMIFGDPSARTLSSEETTPPSEVDDRAKVKTLSNSKKKMAPKNFTKKGSAMEFVQKMRKESLLQTTSTSFGVRTKEQEVSEIGVSLQKRLMDASSVVLRKKSEYQELHGDEISFSPNSTGRIRSKFLPQDFSKMTSVEFQKILKNCVIFDAHDIIGLNKPYGIPMFGESQSCQHSLEKYLPFLAHHLNTENLYQVHRLDKTTTGVVLFAKTIAMQNKLVELFRSRKMTKVYWSILNGTPSPAEGIIDIPLSDKSVQGRYRMSLRPDYKGSDLKTDQKWKSNNRSNVGILPAVTEYTTLVTKGNASLVEVRPVTGFKHQIRAHLGLGLGTPVLGDHKYSWPTELGRPQKVHGDILKSLEIRFSQSRHLPTFLHSKNILIPEIVEGKELWVDAKLPHFFTAVMKKLHLSPKTKIKM